jgi:hypothetical protein
MALSRFEDVDVLRFLGEIVKRHVEHYKEDFDLDKGLLRTLAKKGNAEDKRLLWMARPAGTWCLREQEAYLQDSRAYNTWKFYGEQTRDKILAYALELKTGAKGCVIGTIHELDYAAHTKRLKMLAVPIAYKTFRFEDGTECTGDRSSFNKTDNALRAKYGEKQSFVIVQHPESAGELAMILKRERFKRDYHSIPITVEDHIRDLFIDLKKNASVKAVLGENKKTIAESAPTKTAKDRQGR